MHLCHITLTVRLSFFTTQLFAIVSHRHTAKPRGHEGNQLQLHLLRIFEGQQPHGLARKVQVQLGRIQTSTKIFPELLPVDLIWVHSYSEQQWRVHFSFHSCWIPNLFRIPPSHSTPRVERRECLQQWHGKAFPQARCSRWQWEHHCKTWQFNAIKSRELENWSWEGRRNDALHARPHQILWFAAFLATAAMIHVLMNVPKLVRDGRVHINIPPLSRRKQVPTGRVFWDCIP